MLDCSYNGHVLQDWPKHTVVHLLGKFISLLKRGKPYETGRRDRYFNSFIPAYLWTTQGPRMEAAGPESALREAKEPS
jgi:hypothetical protein